MGTRDLLRASCSGGLGRGELAQARARTLKGRVYQVMRRETIEGQRGSIIARDVYLLMGGVDLGSIYSACKALRQAGLVRFIEGSCRQMEIAPGAPEAIFDQRGRGYTSLVNLKYFGDQVKRNTKASMSTPRRIKGRSFVKDW